MRLDYFQYFRRVEQGRVGMLPSYEDPDMNLFVMETVYITNGGLRAPFVVPRSYLKTIRRGSDAYVRLHEGEDAADWRPLLYVLKFSHTERQASQTELEYRAGLADLERGRGLLKEQFEKEAAELELVLDRPVDRKAMLRDWLQDLTPEELGEYAPSEFFPAVEKARALLLEQLSPQQKLEYLARGAFHVRGTINKLYRLGPAGHGASIVDPYTLEQRVALCIHTEEWIPSEDNMLACKLLIESGQEGEKEMLEAARPFPSSAPAQRPYQDDIEAWPTHRKLLPGPQEVIAA